MACFEDYKKFRQPTPCDTCPKPFLDETNVEVWKIFELLHTQARTAGLGGFVSFDLSCVHMLFRAFSVPVSMWRDYLEKLSVIGDVAHKKWAPKKGD